jgi:1-acyl-sn-glycerol-3-phosphate acyltransferase
VNASPLPGSLSGLSLRLAGWQFEGERPTPRKFVGLALPHTTNWDGLLLLAVAETIGLSMRWMIKDSWTKGAMTRPMRKLGAVPINRSRASNLVEQMVEQFQKNDDFVLMIPPEGTRSYTEYWKSGFYHIARGANVPVVPGYLDYARKRAGLGPPIMMTGDVVADMDQIRAFYRKQDPKPFDAKRFGPIRLREEAPKA